MKVSVKLRKWTWELPQSLLGFILTLCYRRKKLKTIEYKDQMVTIYDGFPGGISLGYYSLVDYNRFEWEFGYIRISLKNSIKHEFGHSTQSKYLGPLYLFTVGILSLCHNLICRIKEHYDIEYYYFDFFIEKQADRLGGVVR